MRVLFVHGACVVDGAWWWHRMTAPLAALGWTTAAIELPSCGPLRPAAEPPSPGELANAQAAQPPSAQPRELPEAADLPPARPGAPLGDLHADIAAVRAAAADDAADDGEQSVLVGHSYGGMVITGAAAGLANVVGLVYVAGVLPDADETLAALAEADSPGWLEPADEHTVRVRTDLTEADIRAHFLADCDEQAARGALARLGQQAATAFGQQPGAAAWRTIPATAVVCAEDRATPPARQRDRARRADRVVELAAGHHPFLSRPDELADIIAAAPRRAPAR